LVAPMKNNADRYRCRWEMMGSAVVSAHQFVLWRIISVT